MMKKLLEEAQLWFNKRILEVSWVEHEKNKSELFKWKHTNKPQFKLSGQVV